MLPLHFRAAILIAAAGLAGCDDGGRERKRLLEQRLTEAEARAGRAENEVHRARLLLEQQASMYPDAADQDAAEGDDGQGQGGADGDSEASPDDTAELSPDEGPE